MEVEDVIILPPTDQILRHMPIKYYQFSPLTHPYMTVWGCRRLEINKTKCNGTSWNLKASRKQVQLDYTLAYEQFRPADFTCIFFINKQEAQKIHSYGFVD